MTKAEYADYLRTPHWQSMRTGALNRAGHRCQVCNASKNLHVHHRTYERCPGNERAGDLTVLCADCHALYHDKPRVATPAANPKRVNGSKPNPPQKLSKSQRKKQRQRQRERDAKALNPGALADSLAQMKARNKGKPLRIAQYSQVLDIALGLKPEKPSAAD